MLGLGAQHLTLCSKVDYTKQALSHRIKAIKSLNQQLSRLSPSKEEGDAAFGAFMSLCFQSAYMADGMFDFISMIRGCKSLTPISPLPTSVYFGKIRTCVLKLTRSMQATSSP